MLRLVHPRPAGQGTDPPARRKGSRSAALFLTPDETRLVRAALRNTGRAYGGQAVLATVMGIPHAAVKRAAGARRRLSGTFAIRLARAAGVSVESILTGALTAAGRCPTCGHRAGGAR